MKSKALAAGVIALAVAVGGGALVAGNANAATPAHKAIGHTKVKTSKIADKGSASHSQFKPTIIINTDIATLLGFTTDNLKTELKTGKSLATIAGEKNIPVQSVIDLEAQAITSALNQQLSDGKITQTQYDSLKTNITTWATKFVNDTFKGKAGIKNEGTGLGNHGYAAVLDDTALANLLGMTSAELKTAVQSGKSLATIAGEKNVTVQAVIDQMTITLTADLDKQLANNQITQAKYDEEKAALTTEVTNYVNGKVGGKGVGHGRGGHGRGGHGTRG